MSRDKRSKATKDDPDKRVHKRVPATVSAVNRSAADDIKTMIEACGDILEANEFDRNWPPTKGENVLAVDNTEGAAWYAARCILHCKSVLSALDSRDAEKAVYNALRAREYYWVAYYRENGLEQALWRGDMQVAHGSWYKPNKSHEDRELLAHYEEFLRQGFKGSKWRAFAAYMFNLEHSNDKPRTPQSMTKTEINTQARRVRRAQEREKKQHKH